MKKDLTQSSSARQEVRNNSSVDAFRPWTEGDRRRAATRELAPLAPAAANTNPGNSLTVEKNNCDRRIGVLVCLCACLALLGCGGVVGSNLSSQPPPSPSLQLSVNPGQLVYGAQPVGTTSPPQVVQLTNSGQATITISSLTITGPFDFTGPSLPVVLGSAPIDISVTFTPTQIGPTGTFNLTIVSDASNPSTQVQLTGTGTGPAISVTPLSIDFGNQAVNTTSAARSVTLTNTGNADLLVNTINIGPSQFSVAGPAPPSTIGPSSTANYSVTFTPTAEQAFPGQLTFASNASTSPTDVSLAGSGVSGTTLLNTSPTSLSFGIQTVGTTSSAQTVTLSNGGATSITISNVVVSGSPFAFTGWTGSSTLLSGQSMNLQVTFSPAAEASFTGTLTVTSNAPSSPDSVALSGTGVAPSPPGQICGMLDDGQVHIAPDYTTFTPPAKGQSYIDPAYGCSVTRLSNGAAESGGRVVQSYATFFQVNADNSQFLIWAQPGDFYTVDINGNTIVPQGSFEFGSDLDEPRWHRTDPNVIYYTSGNQMKKATISGASVSHSVVRTFSQFGDISFTGAEGDLSDDGDHMLIIGGGSTVGVYTISTDTLGPTGSVSGIDNCHLTPSNRVSCNHSGVIDLYDQSMNFVRQVLPFNGHSDVGMDVNGDEVIVIFAGNDSASSCPGGNGFEKVRLDDSAKTCVVALPWWGDSSHVAFSLNGWVVMSWTDYGGGTAGYPLSPSWQSLWQPYMNEIVVAKLDGTVVQRLVHHRSRAAGEYWKLPKATISMDGRYVIFSSDMGQGDLAGGDYADVYVIAVQ